MRFSCLRGRYQGRCCRSSKEKKRSRANVFETVDLLESKDKHAEQHSDTLQTEYEAHREQWKEVLDRRHRDVRLHSGASTNKTQFRVMDSSFWEQVDATVQHEQLRQKQQRRQQNDRIEFDDAKVYQHMLKDFVSQRAGNNSSSDVQLVVPRRNKQKMASSNKPTIDR